MIEFSRKNKVIASYDKYSKPLPRQGEIVVINKVSYSVADVVHDLDKNSGAVSYMPVIKIELADIYNGGYC